MSHTREYKAPGYEFVRVVVNDDWSGPATIIWRVAGATETQEVDVPGFVLKAICKVEGRAIFEEGLGRFLDRLEEPPS